MFWYLAYKGSSSILNLTKSGEEKHCQFEKKKMNIFFPFMQINAVE